MANLTLGLLGSLQVTVANAPITNFESDKARALLAYLAVEADRPQRREALIGLLWPDCPEDIARQNLRQSLYNLRQAIGDHRARPPYLLITREEIQFNTASDYALDVAAFHAHLAATDTHNHSRLEACAICAARLQQAVGLYRGEFLQQFFLEDSAEFEEWALVQRETLHRRVLEALVHLANYHEQRAEYEAARGYALRQLELDPWREEAHRQVMRVLALSGQRSEALAQYESCRRVLAKELGVESSAETKDLYEQIVRGDLVGRTEVKYPTAVYDPPALPIQLTPFMGREHELAELGKLLGDDECRLITLVGPGGIGKTRLALEAASRHGTAFAQGAAFVPLAPVDSVGSIIPAIAEALRFGFYGPGDPQLQLLNYLHDKQLLLILDNVEHLLEAAGLWVEILQRARRVKLLLTSREALNLQGEWVLGVEGLPIPEDDQVDDLETYPAAALFLQRARRAQVSFALRPEDRPPVARLCRLVGGMPLALELAAAWVRTLAPEEIEREIEHSLDFLTASMRDLPERHRSMRAVFDHSWHLLSAEEQAVLARLSIFRGGFQREAAEQIAGATLSLLSTLQAKSFLRRLPSGRPAGTHSVRYDLHELVQQYAAERLHENPEEEAAARNRHSDYYLAFLKQCETSLQSSRQRETIGELTLEIDNLRLAWERAADRGALSRLQQVAWPMFWYYEVRNLLAEGESAFRQAGHGAQIVALEPADRAAAEIALAHLQAYQAHFAHRQSRNAEATQMLEQSLQVLRRYNDRAALNDALWIYGTAGWMVGDLEQAYHHLSQALTLERELDRPWPLADGHISLGYVEFERGNYAESERWLREGLALSRGLGDPTLTAFAIAGLCRTLKRSGQFPEMEVLLREGYRLAKESGNRLSLGLSLEQLAEIAEARGDISEASRFCQESIALYRETGDEWSLSRTLTRLGGFQLAGGAETEARKSFVEALEIAHRGGFNANAVDALVGIASDEASKGLVAPALELILHLIEVPATSREAKSRAEQLRGELESHLTPDEIEAIQVRVRADSFETSVQELLSAKR